MNRTLASGGTQGFFYGWVIAGVAALGIACSFSVLVVTTTPIFAGPLSAQMGWSLRDIYLGPTVAALSGLIPAPIIGALSDRLGARRIVLISFAIEVLILASFRYLTPSIYGFWLRYGLMALLCMGTTQIVFSRILSAWFKRRLGLAVGIALAGVGIGGFGWSVLLQKLIDVYSWRDAYLVLAALIACINFPLLGLLLRDSPASMGLAVDGAADQSAASSARENQTGMRLTEAASTGYYWLIVLTYFLIGLALQGAQLHVIPLLKSHGVTAQLAASAQAWMLATVIVGRITSGLLLDYFFAPRIAQVFLLAPIIGVSALTLGASGSAAIIAAMGIGLAVGGESDVIAYLVRRYFGLREYGRIYGTFFSAFGMGSAVGPPLMAWGVEHSVRGYGTVLWFNVAVLLLGVCLMFGYPSYARE